MPAQEKSMNSTSFIFVDEYGYCGALCGVEWRQIVAQLSMYDN